MFSSGPVLPPPLVFIPRSAIPSTPIPKTADEATINEEHAQIFSFQCSLDNKMDHLDASIYKLVNSISGNTSSDQANKALSDALMMNNNIEYDTFVRNPPNLEDFSDTFNDPLSDTLFSNSSSNSPIPNSFNISSFNVNGLKTPGQAITLDLDPMKHGRSSGEFLSCNLWRFQYEFRQIYIQQPQAASQRVHKLFYHLLSHNYEDCTPLNLTPTLGTYHHLDTVMRIDFVWSC
ncbi:unnamed protein product [Rhizophagus irregularis]|nr:unnamed protein product [Rhizophagus irregularis]